MKRFGLASMMLMATALMAGFKSPAGSGQRRFGWQPTRSRKGGSDDKDRAREVGIPKSFRQYANTPSVTPIWMLTELSPCTARLSL